MRNISREIIFTQDYSPEQDIPDPNNPSNTITTPERYTETFSVTKIEIERTKVIEIENLQIQINPLKTKNPNTNPVKLAFVLSSYLDSKIYKDPLVYPDTTESKTRKIIDDLNFVDLNSTEDIDITPNDFELYSSERYAYYDVRDISEYRNYSAFSLLSQEKVVYQCVIIGVTYAPSGRIQIFNTNRNQFLYLIPFVPNLQLSRLSATALVNFTLYDHGE